MKEFQNIRLSQQEVELLRALGENDVIVAQEVMRLRDNTISLSPIQAESLRSRLTEILAEAGFDDRYRLTPVGEMIESLIDRFFIE